MTTSEQFLNHVKEVLSNPENVIFNEALLPKDISIADGKYFLSLVYKATKASESDIKKTVALKVIRVTITKTKKSTIINPFLSSKLWKMFSDQHRAYYRNNLEPVDPNYSENYYMLLDHMLDTFKQELGLDNDNIETPFSKYWKAIKIKPADKNKTFTNLTALVTSLQPDKPDSISKFKHEMRTFMTSPEYNSRVRNFCELYSKKAEKLPFFEKNEGILREDCMQAKKEYYNLSEKEYYFGDCDDKMYDLLKEVVDLDEKRHSLVTNLRPEKQQENISKKNIIEEPKQIQQISDIRKDFERQPIEMTFAPNGKFANLQKITDSKSNFANRFDSLPMGSHVSPSNQRDVQQSSITPVYNNSKELAPMELNLPRIIQKIEDLPQTITQKNESLTNSQRNYIISTKPAEQATNLPKFKIFNEIGPNKKPKNQSLIKDPILEQLNEEEFMHFVSPKISNKMPEKVNNFEEIIPEQKENNKIRNQQNQVLEKTKNVLLENDRQNVFKTINFELKESRVEQITEMKFPDIGRLKSLCYLKKGKLFENEEYKIGVSVHKEQNPSEQRSILLQCFYDNIAQKGTKIAMFQISYQDFKISSHPDESYVELKVEEFFQNGRFPMLKVDFRDKSRQIISKEIDVFIPITKFMFVNQNSDQLVKIEVLKEMKLLTSGYYLLDHNYFKSSKELMIILQGFKTIEGKETTISGDFELLGIKSMISMKIMLNEQGEFKVDLYFMKNESEMKVKSFMNEFVLLLIDPTTL